jgi:alkylation response protein AidB-like acyl-CoA dehydrogenase
MLTSGRMRWVALHPFPEQDPADRKWGDQLVHDVDAFIDEALDPGALDNGSAAGPDLLAELRRGGWCRLRESPDLGGRGASDYNAFRVVERFARASVAAGQMVAIQHAVGVAALIPAVPSGPLADHLRRRVSEGVISGFGVTEPTGQNNTWPSTTATPTTDGYLLDGGKVYIGHAPVAELLAISATVPDGADRRLGVFFVDTTTPGFRTVPVEFVGSRGLPNGEIRLARVKVAREHAIVGEPGDPRMPAAIRSVALLSALYFTGAPALAVARNCLQWTRDFVARRTIDGRGLVEYEQIQHRLAATMADVYAVDTVLRWCLVDAGLTDRPLERTLAKNIATVTAWRVADRTVSLLGGEGLETVASKQRRGVPALPVERALRDARGLRVAGNVDFRLDAVVGTLLVAGMGAGPADPVGLPEVDSAGPDLALTPANLDHRRAADDDVARFARVAAALGPAPGQEQLARLGQAAAELLTVSLVLARTSHLARTGECAGHQELADVCCTAARARLAAIWRALDAPRHPDETGLSRRLLAGELDHLTHS